MKRLKKTLLFLFNFVLLAFFLILFMPEPSYTLPSRFTGKTVKKIEYIGLKELPDGSVEFVQMQSMSKADIQSLCLTEVGYPLDPAVVAGDIKALVEEGQFLDVHVEASEYDDGVSVRFFFKERPVIDIIEYRGTEELAETDLSDLVPLKSGDPYRKDYAEHGLQMIKDKYISEGYFNVVVTYEIEETDNENDNKVILVYKIDEGEEIKIEKISLLGTNKINDTRLREIMETKEDGIFSDGKFNRSAYELDKQKIVAWYRQEGYLDADIIEDSVSYEWVNPEKKDKRGIYIKIKVHEGERYYFDKYTIEGNEIISTDYIFKRFELRHAEKTPLTRAAKRVAAFFGHYIDDDTVCNDTLFQKDRYMIAFEYGTKGYLFTRVIPKKNISEREVIIDGKKEIRKYVHYHLTIVEGTQAYIENIIVKGNDKTKDKVIRRELLFKEGELYNAKKIQQTREILFKLGYFKEVNIDIRPGSSSEKINLIVSVVEDNTGTLSLGGGYSSNAGFSIFATIGERNLLGYGYSIETKLEYSPTSTSVSVTFTDRWFMDYPVSFTTSIFYSMSTIATTSIFDSDDYAYYDRQTIGYSLGFGYRPWTYYTIGTIWTHSFKEILNPSGNASEEVMRLEALGMQEKRKLTFYASYDTTDSSFNPTKGVNLYLGYSMIGGILLWGDDHYTKLSPKVEWFYSPFTLPYLKDYPVVLQLRANAHFLMPPLADSVVRNSQDPYYNPWLEQEDMLYLGGPESLRGWDYYGDSDMPESWQYRLYHTILYGAEIRVPIHPQFLWFALFFDAGALYTDSYWDKYSQILSDIEDDYEEDKEKKRVVDIKDIHTVDPLKYFKYSYGFGFRLQIPMLPLRFWFAKKAIWDGFTGDRFKTISDYTFQLQLGDVRY